MKKTWNSLFFIMFSIVGLCVFTVFSLSQTVPTLARHTVKPTVILDPGHGGMDGGCVGSGGIVEKNINLSIALKLQQMLTVNGVEVYMTRTEDQSIHDDGVTGLRYQKVSDMNNRLKLAKDHPEALFVSIHQNQFPASQYSGAQIFYSPNDPGSETMAAITQRRFREMLQPQNGRETKKAGDELFLLYYAKTPAIMAECGFLSNHEEAAALADEAYQEKVAFVLFSSILEYLGTADQS